ncbi:MAG: citrate lyase holo-[acyl-carrier protein] synthase [Desulfovibrionaceae bacterium]
MSSPASILLARENRWLLRREAARQTSGVVVCCTLVVPGADKNPSWGDYVFLHVTQALACALERAGIPSETVVDEDSADGRFMLLHTTAAARRVKRVCVAVEDGHPLGRLADFDVMCEDGEVVGRSELGLPARTCLVCDAPAARCVRSGCHSLAVVKRQIMAIIDDFTPPTQPGKDASSLVYGPGEGGMHTRRASSLAEQAVVELERMIFNGELQSGAHIKELEIANMLEISRGVVREAFMSLAQSGLVEFFPHRGVFVRSFTYAETLEMFDVRAHLALMAMREAAQNITPRIAAELGAILDRIDASLSEGDPTQEMTFNWDFHQRIYSLCDNNLLREMAADIRRKQFLSCRHTFRVPTSVQESNQEHRVILRHLAAGDGANAGKAMFDHIMCGKRRFVTSINRARTGPSS